MKKVNLFCLSTFIQADAMKVEFPEMMSEVIASQLPKVLAGMVRPLLFHTKWRCSTSTPTLLTHLVTGLFNPRLLEIFIAFTHSLLLYTFAKLPPALRNVSPRMFWSQRDRSIKLLCIKELKSCAATRSLSAAGVRTALADEGFGTVLLKQLKNKTTKKKQSNLKYLSHFLFLGTQETETAAA